jgi:hypothetical protein
VNTNTTGAKGLLDYVDVPTAVHAVIIVLVALIIYHVLFHTA